MSGSCNVRQAMAAISSCIREPVTVVVGIEDQFSDQLAGAVGKAAHLLDELAGQHLFQQLVQEKTAHAPRADRQFDLERIAGIKRDGLNRLRTVRMVPLRT